MKIGFRLLARSASAAALLAAVLFAPIIAFAQDFASTTGNILMVRSNTLYEISDDGAVIDSIVIPSASSARGLTILDDNRIAIYDAPNLRVYDPSSDTWEISYVDGWTRGSSSYAGRLEQVGDYIYATHHAYSGTPKVVRFSMADLSGVFVETANRYIDLSYGPNEVLYGLYTSAGYFNVLDPDTLDVLESNNFAFGFDQSAIAVNASEQIFSPSSRGTLVKFDSSGAFITSQYYGSISSIDVDVASDGAVVVGGRQIALADESLSTFRLRNPGGGSSYAFVEFVDPIADTDADGMPDRWEERYGLDPASPADVYDDNDNDGLVNIDEYENRTNPLIADTDADGLNDNYEVNTSGTSPRNADTDKDGLTDGEEVSDYGTNPNAADSDSDELTDFDEINLHGTNPLSGDTDGDQMLDKWELDNGLDPIDPADAAVDSDVDGLTNLEEFTEKTDPNNADSDGDAILDGDEVNTHATDPLNRDTDGDLLDDGREIAQGLDPLTSDGNAR